MSTAQESATIEPLDDNHGAPSIEEQYEALKSEGLIADDDDTNSADTSAEQDAQGGASEDAEGSTDERSGVPEKFRNEDGSVNTEALMAAYAELERKQSGNPEEEAAEAPEAKSGEPTAEERAAAEEATKRAGLDLNEVSAEWNQNGGLSEDTYTKLDGAGYPREMVDIYIEGLLSRNAGVTQEAYNIVGDQEEYQAMIDWAVDNLSEEEQAAFDEAVNSRDKRRTLTAIKALNSDYQAAMAELEADASEEPEVTVSGKGHAKADVYTSEAEYMEDVEDPRYDSSEKFRNAVIAKLARSNF